jgi:hypothetical protein
MVYTLLLYSLDHYRQTESQTEERINPVWAGKPEDIGASRLILFGLGNQKKLVPPG